MTYFISLSRWFHSSFLILVSIHPIYDFNVLAFLASLKMNVDKISVVSVSICYYSSSTNSRTIIFLITVPVTVLEPKSFQLLFQFQFWNHNFFNFCSSSSSGTLMFQILVLVLVPLLLLCKISNKCKQKLSNPATNYVYYSTPSWSSSHLN